MKKYYHQLLFVFLASALIFFLVLFVNTKWSIRPESQYVSKVQMEAEPAMENVSSGMEASFRRALILYSPEDPSSCSYMENLTKALDILQFSWETQSLDRSDAVSYPEYDLVILASSLVEEEMADPLVRLLDYVQEGGRLFWGILPNSTASQFASVYRQLGIVEYGDYVGYHAFTIEKDLVPGASGRTFDSAESFEDVGIAVTLESQATVSPGISGEGSRPAASSPFMRIPSIPSPTPSACSLTIFPLLSTRAPAMSCGKNTTGT